MTTDRLAWRSAVAIVSVAGLLTLIAVIFALTGSGMASVSGPGDPSAPSPDSGSERRSDRTDDDASADPAADPSTVLADAAQAMGAVTSVEFSLERGGAPVFIDEFDRLALDAMRGQFQVPNRAQAELTVTVEGDLATRLGAVAIDGEVWLSNPVTGAFEPLPPGYDLDPSQFFDPAGGWRPLLANLRDVELVEIDDRDGERYRLRGVAPAADVENITVGLVRDQDVTVELWIHPTSSLVTSAEFLTGTDDERSDWRLDLDRYGETFTIVPPDLGASGD